MKCLKLTAVSGVVVLVTGCAITPPPDLREVSAYRSLNCQQIDEELQAIEANRVAHAEASEFGAVDMFLALVTGFAAASGNTTAASQGQSALNYSVQEQDNSASRVRAYEERIETLKRVQAIRNC